MLLGSCYNVYICVTKPPQDFVHQDGRRLAHIQSYDSLFRGDKNIVKLNFKNLCKRLIYNIVETTGYPTHLHRQLAGR